MVETKAYVCEQCAVQNKPRESVTFATVDAAEEHAAFVHSYRFIEMYKRGFSPGTREANVHHMLRDRFHFQKVSE